MLKKIFYQPLRPYPVTAPIHFKFKNNCLGKILAIKPFSSIFFSQEKLRSNYCQLDLNERIVELPFIFNNLDFKKKGQVLDVGCCESTVVISLASLGFKVTGIDIRAYDLKHPNFEFVKDNICQTKKLKKKFDYVLMLSVVEHIGLETIYGKTAKKTDDYLAIQKAYQLLKPGGKLLLTAPACKKYFKTDFMRHYDQKYLSRLLINFRKVDCQFYAPDDNRQYWQEVKANNLPSKPSFGVTTVVAVK